MPAVRRLIASTRGTLPVGRVRRAAVLRSPGARVTRLRAGRSVPVRAVVARTIRVMAPSRARRSATRRRLV
jgi:hypothetical protein